jgi:hypothetical protein
VQRLIDPLTTLILSTPTPIETKPDQPYIPPPDLFRITCRALNVRNAPTTSGSHIIGQLPRGALIAAIGQHPDPNLKALWRQFGENVWSAQIYRGVSYMEPY